MHQRVARPHMLAHHQLCGVAQVMAVLALARRLGEMPRRLGDGGQSQPAGGADDILRQPSGFVPLLAGAGVRQPTGQLLGGDDIALQDFHKGLYAH
jgi:hypothetical protein